MRAPSRSSLSIIFGIALSVGASGQAEPLPKNLGAGLDKLVAWHLAHPQPIAGPQRRAQMIEEHPLAREAQLNAAATAATVDVRLDGSQPLAAVRAAMEALGGTVHGVFDIGRAGSIVTVRLPLGKMLEAAKSPGVLSLSLAQKPRRHAAGNVGKVTSQGVGVMKVDKIPYTGAGLTVGVISDSYDHPLPTPKWARASEDVLSGDLPGVGNPNGHTQPVNVLLEGTATGPLDQPDTDEGRAMLQIIHDVAPGAGLAFSSSGDSQTVFAQSILDLRTKGGADVIVDDISFPDEPFFSDGPIALAVEDAVNSTTLAGRRVAYYSAAGNDGTIGLDDTWRPVSDADARARRPKHNLKLSSVPKTLTAGGFHNFGTAEAPVIAQRLSITGLQTELDLQWDDPFVPSGNNPQWITTDYNILVFNGAGTYLKTLGGVDENLTTGEAVEFAFLDSSSGRRRTYQIAITRKTTAAPTATHLRYLVFTDGNFQATPFQRMVPTTYGHAAAHSADGVAAYHYDELHTPTDFTSTGPVTIYFDRNGVRLNNPEVRSQPTIAAPDLVNTTFFPPDAFADTDSDSFPNFSGTSAAAPHAAGVAALLLEAKGGHGSLTAAQLRTALQGSSSGHDLDPFYSKAVVTGAGATTTLEARGDESNNSSNDPRFLKLSFAGPATARVTQVSIDLTPTPLVFDPTSALGLPFRVGAYTVIGKKDFVGTVSKNPRTVLTLKLKNHTFAPGATIEFGMDRDLAAIKAEGNSADRLEGAIVTVTTLDNGVTTTSTGVFANSKGKGYSRLDGFGLIDAQAAVGLLPP